MATVIPFDSPAAGPAALPLGRTAADMQERLGQIPLERILIVPPPGRAAVEDVEKERIATGRICELVDGALVEKAVGYYESRLAAVLIHFIERFLDTAKLGMVLAPDGTLEILSKLVRAADVSFIRWDRLPGGKLPEAPIPELVPNLAVEILSKSNTPAEMKRKRGEYFEAGVQLVWIIDPKTRWAAVYTELEEPTAIDPDGTLSGGEVLPGFELRLAELFARAEPPTSSESSNG
jgi:Uma2 family endonuclease